MNHLVQRLAGTLWLLSALTGSAHIPSRAYLDILGTATNIATVTLNVSGDLATAC